MPTETTEQCDAPERIWLLKAVMQMLGTEQFAVPPELRDQAVEYARVHTQPTPASATEEQGAPDRVWARVPGYQTSVGVQFGDYVGQPIEGFVEYVHVDRYDKVVEALRSLRHHLQKQPDVVRLIDAALHPEITET